VQLIGTAHGRTLENLLLNPTLSDLVGGMAVVTLGDEEARRRGTQKTVLERKAPPTFDLLVEQEERHLLGIHHNVATAVDELLRGEAPQREMRERLPDGSIRRWTEHVTRMAADSVGLPTRELPAQREEPPGGRRGGRSALAGQPPRSAWWEERRNRGRDETHSQETHGQREQGRNGRTWLDPELALSAPLLEERERVAATGETGGRKRRIFPLGVNRSRLDQAIRQLGVPAEISRTGGDADAVFVLKNMARKQPDRVEAAEAAHLPVYTLRNDSLERLREALVDLFAGRMGESDAPVSGSRFDDRE